MIEVGHLDNNAHCITGIINQKITIPGIHLAEDLRCRDEIQLLEGPILLLPCPGPGFTASGAGFKEFLFEVPAREYEVEGIFAPLKI